MASIKDLVKKKIITDMIRTVQPEGKWKILVIDPNSLMILNSVCRLNDILDENVTLIEDITRKRQAFPQKEAIYFITPEESSIRALISDFTKSPVTYKVAHIFCTAGLSDSLFAEIKKSPALQYVKTLKELSIDFIALEQQAFILNMEKNFFNLYSPQRTQSQLNEDVTLIAKKIMSVCATMSECPHIRYFDPTNSKHNPAYKLATALQSELDEFSKQDPNFPPTDTSSSTKRKGTILIVERTFDMLAPLLHEFTYQAMINDLLVLKNGKLVRGESEDEKKVGCAALDEQDPIWRLIRHWHFAEAVEYISDAFGKFISGNKAAVAALGAGSNPDSSSGIDGLNELKDTLSALPEFQEMKQKFSLHINICQESKAIFEERNLPYIAGAEQDLATGETSEGKPVKAAISTMAQILYDSSVSTLDKLRLLMIYIISQDGINDSDRRKLLEYAKLTVDDSQAISNLAHMGMRLVPLTDAKEKKAALDARGPYTYRGKKGDKRRNKNTEMSYDLSRYIPLLKLAMEDEINGNLSTQYFPYTKDAPDQKGQKKNTTAQSSAAKGQSQPVVVNGVLMGSESNPYSLRTLRATWATSPGAKKSDDQGEQGGGVQGNENADKEYSSNITEYRKNGARLIVFVVGGMTYSEVRSCYEVIKETKREVLIGSTHIWNPSNFVESLKELHKNDPKLPQTKPPTSVQGNSASLDQAIGYGSDSNMASQGSLKDKDTKSKKEERETSKNKFGIFKKK